MTGRVKTQGTSLQQRALNTGKICSQSFKVTEIATLKHFKDNAAVGLFRTKIGLDEEISSLNFSIDVVDGIAYLSGLANNTNEMNKVIYHAENTRFINEVISYIVVSTDQRD